MELISVNHKSGTKSNLVRCTQCMPHFFVREPFNLLLRYGHQGRQNTASQIHGVNSVGIAAGSD